MNTFISSRFEISHKIIDSLFLASIPVVQRYLLSLLSVSTFTLSKGVVNIFKLLPFSALHILIIEFGPS